MSNGEKGSALLTVLWLTAALAAVGIAVASNVRSESERTATAVDDTKAALIARGAIERAALHLLWSRMYGGAEGPFPYGRLGDPSMELTFPDAEAHVEIIPETSKLNINTIRPEELVQLLLALGQPEDRAEEIAGAILDWRTPLRGTGFNGSDRQSPFDEFYLSRAPSFPAPHASFLENEELLQVKGVTPDLYYGSSLPPGPRRPGLRDCVSVFGSPALLDINQVQPAVMAAIGIEASDISAIVAGRQVDPVRDMQRLAQVTQSLGPAGGRLRYGGRSMFTLRATARLRGPDGRLNDLRRTVAALLKIDFPGNREKQVPKYEVVRWYDRN